jgi:two-component system chemotaxis response regulator CheB
MLRVTSTHCSGRDARRARIAPVATRGEHRIASAAARCQHHGVPARDIVVVGGSAGGVAAVVDLVRALPRDLPAAMFVALHVAPDSAGLLPEILDRLGTVPVEMAHDGADVRTGRILVAPPDCHLILEQGLVRLRRTPRVNRFRPSIDVLFRSAATAYGARVAAVILSGMLDDGALGLLTVKQNGGIAIVQDTLEAAFTGMPLSALDRAPVAHVLPVAEIAGKLVELTTPRRRGARVGHAKGAHVAKPRKHRSENATRGAAPGRDGRWLVNGHPALYGCPDCGGALLESDADGVLRFRCRIGHGYSAESLLASQDERLEDALWTAVRALEEGAATKRRMASRSPSAARHGSRRNMRSGPTNRLRTRQRFARSSTQESGTASCARPTDAQEGSGQGRPERSPRSARRK